MNAATVISEIDRRREENRARNLRFSREYAALVVDAITQSELTIKEIDARIGRGRFVNKQILKMLDGKGTMDSFTHICAVCGFKVSFEILPK